MDVYLKLAVTAVITAILALTLRRKDPELGMLAAIAGCCICGGMVLELLSPVLRFARELYEKTGLSAQYLSPLLKSAGIGIMTQLAAAVCQDASEGALAKLVELGGIILCLVVSFPLLTAVLELIGRLAGDSS